MPAYTSALPHRACLNARKGGLIGENPMLYHYRQPNLLKQYTSISLHAREVDVISTIAEYPFLLEHVLLQTSQLA